MSKYKELEQQLQEERKARFELCRDYTNLHVKNAELETLIKELREQVVSEKAKYASLLERYISKMEWMANNEHTNMAWNRRADNEQRD